MSDIITKFELVDLTEFEKVGYLEKVNNEFFKPLGYYLLFGIDAFSGDPVFTIIKAQPVENKTQNNIISINNESKLLSDINGN
jgi:hypothetical protein